MCTQRFNMIGYDIKNASQNRVGNCVRRRKNALLILIGVETLIWILGRVSGIPGRFCRGWLHHRQLGKGERAWDREHRTHSLIFNY